jgi:hypothetical protein
LNLLAIFAEFLESVADICNNEIVTVCCFRVGEGF